ncbi:hypothetical protein [Tuwongella immobilis]|uniref:Lipoprotein n=1 Tax=Tuwongella immobilis TaxID=692036 RepID=A0A6C2YJ12_9BACT|nr:hypothetical protein [Tuwongella immobilis]VIP01354.1 Uncharacterized protein OS=Isosphaera pallida (strain ATCC 43644 / DSM 9630 / IS1B) GN=Isop_3204 PE=4 SV=1 [Tuwongella immobilis]VTR98155.1 Uncharacterized protein OS=Isosphaera pallida (strain ATCC 43644 / DSM 9630 / IS1B) GN=Isop_3204 PE=4 SV=1 [Tuwongella immobilis]
MRRKLLVSLLLFGLSDCSTAHSQPPLSPPTAQQWVEQLGSPRYRDRVAAAQSLRQHGIRSLAALQAGIHSPSPEIARQSRVLLHEIEHQSLAMMLARPQLISLQVQNESISNIFQELERRTGIAFQLLGSPEEWERRISVSIDHQPVWAAIDTVLQVAKLEEVATPKWATDVPSTVATPLTMLSTLTPPLPQNRLAIAPCRTHKRTPQDCQSPLRLRVSPTDGGCGQRTLTASGPIGQLTLEVLPSATPTCREVVGIRITRATDSQGRWIPPQESLFPPVSDEIPLPDAPPLPNGVIALRPQFTSPLPSVGQSLQVPISLRLPWDHSAQTIALEGVIVTRMLTWPLVLGRLPMPNGIQVSELRAEDRLLRLISVERKGDQLHVHAKLLSSADAARANPPARIAAANGGNAIRLRGNMQPFFMATEPLTAPSETPRLELLDDQEQSIPCVAESVTIHESASGALTQDWQLVYQLPRTDRIPSQFQLLGRRTLTLEIPFRLNDLRIP